MGGPSRYHVAEFAAYDVGHVVPLTIAQALVLVGGLAAHTLPLSQPEFVGEIVAAQKLSWVLKVAGSGVPLPVALHESITGVPLTRTL